MSEEVEVSLAEIGLDDLAFTDTWDYNSRVLGTPSSRLFDRALHNVMTFHVVDVKGKGDVPHTYAPVTMIPGHVWGSGQYGPVKSDVMIVGKRPGTEEVEYGRNLCGNAGEELTRILTNLNVNLNSAYVTNVCRFIPPDGGRNLRADHIKDCLPLLMYEFRIVRPKYMLLLGTDAVKAFFGRKATLKSVRGANIVFDPQEMGKIPTETGRNDDPTKVSVIGTVNPAQSLREPSLTPGLEEDIRRFIGLMADAPGTAPGEAENYFTIETQSQLIKLVDLLIESDVKYFAFDCEWGGQSPQSGGKLRTIQFSWAAGFAAVIVLREENGEWVFNNSSESTELIGVAHELKRLIDRPGVRLIGHFARADAPWLEDIGVPFMKYLYFDTMLADHLLNESADHSLTGLSVRYTPLGRYDYDLENWIKAHPAIVTKTSGYMGIPAELIIPYGAKDADCTFRCFLTLTGLLDQPGNESVRDLFYNVVMPANLPIFEMEQNGILIDADRMVSMLWRYVQKKQELLEDVRKGVGNPDFNPRSYKQKAELLFGSPEDGGFGLMPVKSTGKPAMTWDRVMSLPEKERARVKPAVDSEVLELLSADAPEKVQPVVEMISNFQTIDQMTKNFLRPPAGMTEVPEDMTYDPNMYIEGLLGHIDPDGRIRTMISQTKETGRYGSSRPNLQNWSKRQESKYKMIMGEDVQSLRSCVIAPDGYVLIEADYKSAEVCGLAYISGDKNLIADALGPIKLHAKVAVDILRAPCSYEEVSKAFPHLYVAAKNINFGIPYQRGAKAIARQVNRETKGAANMDADKAQRIIDAWYERYSKVRDYVNWCKSCVRNHPHWIENPYGRRRHFFVSPDESVMAAQEREAVNFPIQSVVADTLSTALYNLWLYKQQNPWCAYRILLAIHDAVMLEVPVEQIEHVVEFVLPLCMVHNAVVPRLNFSFGIDPEIMLRWGEKPKKESLEQIGVPEKYW